MMILAEPLPLVSVNYDSRQAKHARLEHLGGTKHQTRTRDQPPGPPELREPSRHRIKILAGWMDAQSDVSSAQPRAIGSFRLAVLY